MSADDNIPHIGAEELESYAMGRHSEERAAGLEEHLLVCAPCRQRLDENDSYASVMRQAAVKLEATPGRRRKTVPMLHMRAAVACATLAAGAALTVALRYSSATAPSFAVSLAATRGVGIEAKAPAGRSLDLRPDLTGLPAGLYFRLEMVDRLGNRVWQGNTQPGRSVRVPAQQPGTYFARVYGYAGGFAGGSASGGSSGELLREYGLEIQASTPK